MTNCIEVVEDMLDRKLKVALKKDPPDWIRLYDVKTALRLVREGWTNGSRILSR